MAEQGGDQVSNLVNNLTTPEDGSPQLTSMSDLLGLTGPTSSLINGGGAGGYKFSPEEMPGIIKEFQGIRDDLQKVARTAQRMVQVKPPGDEDASKRFAQLANDSGHAYLKLNQDMQDYVSNYIQKLQSAMDVYQKTEQAAADAAKNIEGRL
ncbi:PE domain-containing protein [Solihabitans fulvus]|uniref:PE domain-containing protein n=1 Tax=Solihabitans fulvus TaxID=1892852 RepID=A0A5B2XUK2_9PSEU|nr:PE domain-containing protein [Solihabitans fulvus]KAA2266993.1 PE domain-containing protein [Solihabitans fulvus]